MLYMQIHNHQTLTLIVTEVTGQFRCATLELCNFDAKQSNLCCFDGFCTDLCYVKADVIHTGPQEQNRGLWVGY